MPLIDDVKIICAKLVKDDRGWKELLGRHGLNISAPDLSTELAKELPNIRRDLPGFEDFAKEGRRGIEPGNPGRSLLFHALASPNVRLSADGKRPLKEFPTLRQIEIVENYVYGGKPRSLLDLLARAQGAPIAIAVFANEYRPAADTVHKKHADLCFSRTGVARVGTVKSAYDAEIRGFQPFVKQNVHAIQVLPARYSAYVAIQLKGNKDRFGPMRFKERNPQNNEEGDAARDFWVPLHKLFDGPECIAGLDLHVTLNAHHVNEKLRRVHLELGKQGYDTGWHEPDISKSPFMFTDRIAELRTDPGSGIDIKLLIPCHHDLVEPAEYQDKPLTFKVPKNYGKTVSSSLRIPDDNEARHAPEYVHARRKVLADGQPEDLNDQPNVEEVVALGGYSAQHFIDYTGDGWIGASVPELAVEIPRLIPAYSLVTAPDFFPDCNQRELMDWWEQAVPNPLKDTVWIIPPETLSDERIAPNLQLFGAGFQGEDKTVTAIVSLPIEGPIQRTDLAVPDVSRRPRISSRHSYLPDAASGVFAPGWDVSFDRTPNGIDHLAAYGLGSPFPEDAKLCAALSAFWPAVAPDAARTFEPNATGRPWPTVSPLTDAEIGRDGALPWDGVPGPQVVSSSNLVEYSGFAHVDYTVNAWKNQFTLSLTGQVSIEEYKARIIAMARVYLAIGSIRIEERARWSVLSFRKAAQTKELQEAQQETGVTLQGLVFRFVIYRHGKKSKNPTDHRKRRVDILETVTLFVDGTSVLLKRDTGQWEMGNV